MCHRHLTFKTSSLCGHLIFTEGRDVDCQETGCYISSLHPRNCAAISGRARCQCRRYYTRPERVIEQNESLPTKCPGCSSRSTT
ncbi:hypothetical protein B0F90DRAFT_1691078 [Multifurca ochricompacta]|uniref:Uncharacterized protein n=1 Tax=Multifurca ochricompacta TaxID=376703 RepID=A0AAD4MB22_9AGAM|nr:hypothetical protein B0F90DRAFT_1691078 [Multifurca ochricompacta]